MFIRMYNAFVYKIAVVSNFKPPAKMLKKVEYVTSWKRERFIKKNNNLEIV